PTMLDVVCRPVSLSGGIVPLVEQGIECFKNNCFVLLWCSPSHDPLHVMVGVQNSHAPAGVEGTAVMRSALTSGRESRAKRGSLNRRGSITAEDRDEARPAPVLR